MSTIVDGELDLTEDQIEEGSNYTAFDEKPYDPRPKEDNARLAIAVILVLSLAIILIYSLITVSCHPERLEAIDKFLQIILSPLVALVSAATGFYFGSKK